MTIAACNIDARLLKIYSQARHVVFQSDFDYEIEWQRSRNFEDITETDFLRESAWVVLCSGFREAVVRRHFSYISLCFFDWSSAKEIRKNWHVCRATALRAIAHVSKINAIGFIATEICALGFKHLKEQIRENPTTALQRLPYIGEVTVWHLAKNLGFTVAKPDRHMLRLAQRLGQKSVQHMCDLLSALTGDPPSVVDTVLWRYLTLTAVEK